MKIVWNHVNKESNVDQQPTCQCFSRKTTLSKEMVLLVLLRSMGKILKVGDFPSERIFGVHGQSPPPQGPALMLCQTVSPCISAVTDAMI